MCLCRRYSGVLTEMPIHSAVFQRDCGQDTGFTQDILGITFSLATGLPGDKLAGSRSTTLL